MALFTDAQWNEATKRHELHFVNQQYDLLMVLRWDGAVNDYAFDVSLDEANRIGRSWGPADFDAAAEVERQRPGLHELDAKRSAAK
ncbi:MAG: hypothetical protein GQE15_14125 [Archangiaceae bacterium]|nr:hypothetical protein [Archangiaceae bacterium]